MEKDLENKILAEEKKIERKLDDEQKELKRLNRTVYIVAALIVMVLGGGTAAFAYLAVSSGQVYVEKAYIEAPVTDIAPQNQGILEKLYVQEGDIILANSVVAQVGNSLVKSDIGGLVIKTNNSLGRLVNRGESVASVIDPAELRAVGRIEEDKGLKDIRIGQTARFTVDAFPGKDYQGVVDEIGETSRSSDVVFNISDKRELREFEVKIRFDNALYRELKNGMSAKIWIHKR